MNSLRDNRVLTATAALSVAVALTLAVRDYNLFISYGSGGLPQNVVGWLATNFLGLFSVNQLSKDINAPSVAGRIDRTFLASPLPYHDGPRPTIGRHPIPYRQLDRLPSASVKASAEARFDELATKLQGKGLIDVKKSGYERHYDAMYVAADREWHDVAKWTKGEICHMHRDIDATVHVVLSAADCKQVLETGWGQRHGLSGVDLMQRIAGFSIPATYTLLYAPQNENELAVQQQIIKASIRFMTGSEDDL